MINRRIYISGPMTGVPREEYLRNFRQAEQTLRQYGYRHVVNPANTLICRWPWLYKLLGYKLTLLYDLWLLWHCDDVCRLDGWEASKGAYIENEFACNFGLFCFDHESLLLDIKRKENGEGKGKEV